MKHCLTIVFLCLLSSFVHGQDSEVAEAETIKVLVTITDSGADRRNLVGPPGPGYRRRGSYNASLGAEQAAKRIAQDFQLERQADWLIRPLNIYCLVFIASADIGVEALLEQLRMRPEVDSAQRLNEFELKAGIETKSNKSDPYSELQYTIDTLQLSQAHQWSTGEGVSIAVIDTGADVEHPDLKTQIESHEDFAENQNVEFVEDAHGTAVSGVIGAASGNGFGIVGVAPSAKMSVLRACWYRADRISATCNTFSIAKALTHAIEEGADIVNLSLGGPEDALLSQLVQEGQRRGIVFVGAANGADKPGFPTNVPGVIVADMLVASAATTGSSSAAVHAPGEDILVATPRGGFDYSSGSSLSAAHVTGVVALLVALRPKLESSTINALIADSQQAAGASISACRALAELLDEAGCESSPALSRSF